MSMVDYEAASQLIFDHPGLIFYRGQPIDDARIGEAEAAVGVVFPPTYRRFLADYGALGFGSEEYYGIRPTGAVTDPSSYAVWLTLDLISSGYLPKEMVIVGQDGMGGEYVLDLRRVAKGTECPVVYWHSGMSEPDDDLEVLGQDFGAFFKHEVERDIKRRMN